jgi:hypothetical protein
MQEQMVARGAYMIEVIERSGYEVYEGGLAYIEKGG